MIGFNLVAPSGWKISLLDNVAKRGSGHTPNKKKHEYWNGGIKWVSLSDMSRLDAGYIEETDKEISLLGIKNSSAVLHTPGTVIVSRDAGVGKSAILKTEMAVSQHFIAWRCSDELGLDKWFLYACLQAHKEQFEKQAVGSTIKTIGLPYFKALKVAFPPLPEQRRITAVLDAWEHAIASSQKLVTAKQQRVEWIRSKVLTGGVRLPGFTKPWQTGPIYKVLTEHGLTSTGREQVHSVSVHQGLINQIEHLGRSFAAANTDHYNRVLPGDIVYTKSPTGDFPLGIIKQSRLDKAAIVSPLYGVFTPASRELGTIMDTLFASPAAAERLLAPVVQKGAKNTIAVTNKNFLKAQLHLPTDQSEIVALSELVEAARAELDVHQTELKLLRNQKRGLMQKLLTGQWRVPDSIDALLPKAGEVTA